ncbi:MAG TPA: hypothetical protein VF797_09605, partial [Noviherbaspirillum sp.]
AITTVTEAVENLSEMEEPAGNGRLFLHGTPFRTSVLLRTINAILEQVFLRYGLTIAAQKQIKRQLHTAGTRRKTNDIPIMARRWRIDSVRRACRLRQ